MVQQPWVEIIILTLIGLLEIALAVYVLVTYQKTASIVVFALLTFCISGWVLSNGPVLFLQRGSEIFDVVARSAFLFVMLMFCLLYLFVLLHPYPTLDIHKRFIFILFLPVIFFALLLYRSNSLVAGFENSRYGDTVYGTSYWVYSLYIFFMYILALVELRLRAKGLDDLHRWQMNMLFFALIASGVIGFTSHLVLPYYFHLHPPIVIGPGASLIWLVLMFWVVRRRRVIQYLINPSLSRRSSSLDLSHKSGSDSVRVCWGWYYCYQ